MFHTVISNNLFEAKCCKSKKDICLYQKNDNDLTNEAPMLKNNPVYSVCNNATLTSSKMEIKIA